MALDEHELESYVAKHYEQLIRYAIGYAAKRGVRHEEDVAKDAVHDAYLLMRRKLDQFEVRGRTDSGEAVCLGSWVRTFIVGAASNCSRRERVRRTETLDPSEERLGNESHPIDLAIHNEDCSFLNQAKSALSTRHRSLIEEYFYQGLTYEEIGIAHEISSEAARSRVRRAVVRLAREFAKLANLNQLSNE